MSGQVEYLRLDGEGRLPDAARGNRCRVRSLRIDSARSCLACHFPTTLAQLHLRKNGGKPKRKLRASESVWASTLAGWTWKKLSSARELAYAPLISPECRLPLSPDRRICARDPEVD